MNRDRQRPLLLSNDANLHPVENAATDDRAALLVGADRYRIFIENLAVMFYAAEPHPPYAPIYVSPAFAEFGYPLEDWRDSVDMWTRAIHADDRQRVLQKTEAAMRAGVETDYEYRIVAKNGAVRWVRDRGSFIRDAAGAPVCWQGVMLDITTRKHAEEALVESERRYRQMFEKNRVIKLIIDADTGALVDANPAACRFYGYTREQLTEKNIADINTMPAEQVFAEMRRARDEQRNYFVFRHRLASGAVRDVEVSTSFLHDQNRNLLYSIVQDITERKRTEHALIESEARYRDIFENANDLIYVRDLQGNYLSINKATERVTGYSAEEAPNINIRQIVAPEHLERAQQMAIEEISGSGQTAYELDCITKNGSRVTLEVSSRTIYKDGAPVAVQGIARDVTTRKRAENALKKSEEQYRELFENANDLIYTHDLRGRYTSLNRTGEIVSGYTREEILNVSFRDIVAPEYLEEARRVGARLVAGEECVAYEVEMISKTGRRVRLEVNNRLIRDEAGAPIAVQGIARDITERKRAEEILVTSERRYRSLSEGIMHQVWTAQPDGKIDYVNARTLEYLGKTFEQAVGDAWHSVIHPDDLPECLSRWSAALEAGTDYKTDCRIRRHDGEYRWHQARATAGRAASGEIVSWYGTNTDIHDQKSAEAQLNHVAGHDTLTNLPNRTSFMMHLERATLHARFNRSYRFAVLFLDLDRFKIINDSLGHTTGDKLLVAIAERLNECVRPNDVVARLGGDEFTVLLNDINDPTDAVSVADRILQKLSAPFKLDAYEVFTSASIGIIIADDVPRAPEDFLRDADTAMYRAKAAGKSRYEIFDREMHLRNVNLLQIENDLRRAIERSEFRVFYQPIIRLDTGAVREFEALIRWQHPQHGLVPPNDFIGIAEETGLIVPIGRWILEEAARQTAEWQRRFPAHEHLSVSVNLSAKQLMHPNLTAQVSEILAASGLDARYLKLEVTETMVMENSELALAVISELNRLGIALSTDDFGTGYSSLSYLHRFPFERLKIDRSFVSKMDADRKSEAIVRTILLLAQNLNIETVAEGIETQAQLERLRALGCRAGQGYLFSKPVAAAAAERILRNGSAEENFRFGNFGETKNQRLVELEKVQ